MTAPTTTRPNPPDDRLDGPIHGYFELTYSNYQVLHRTLMQSMPVEWQERMVACLMELDRAFRHINTAETYEVIPSAVWEYGGLSAHELTELGVAREDQPQDVGEDDGGLTYPVFYDRRGDQHGSRDPVLVPLPGGDPVPHYNRGRTYIEPRIDNA